MCLCVHVSACLRGQIENESLPVGTCLVGQVEVAEDESLEAGAQAGVRGHEQVAHQARVRDAQHREACNAV